MEIVWDERTYEGVHAVPAMAMAVMEESGIRRLIDDMCRGDSATGHKLSEGMAVKALVGSMMERGKRPLYRIHDYYSTAPVDLMFGRGVENRSMSDTVLATRVDGISEKDMRMILMECYRLLSKRYGLKSDRLFMDATNYTMYGTKYIESQLVHDAFHGTVADVAFPAYGGNAKDGHNDRVQLNLSHVVDGNGIPLCSRSYDGNTSDITMNRDMIDFLHKVLDMRSYVLMADCKMCVEELIDGLNVKGTRFVTKVPANFNGRLRDTVVSSVLSGRMDESPTRRGRVRYETRDTIRGRSLRVIAYITPRNRKDAESFIRGKGLATVRRSMDVQYRKRYHCEEDALKAFGQALAGSPADCYTADPVVIVDVASARRHGDGMPYRVRSDNVRVDEDRFEKALVTHALQVLITNLDFSTGHSDDILECASADDVVDLYLEQYKAEAGFKMMKSGMNIADVYIHTPSRINAIAFIVSLATMLSKTMDVVLEEARPRGERARTMKALADIHANTLVEYDRAHDRLSVMGHPGATSDVFSLLERLSIDPVYLLSH